MRLLFFFLFVGLISCSQPEKEKKEIFIVNWKELDENCEPNTKILTLNFSAELTKMQNSIWTSFSEFKLENGDTLFYNFYNNELRDEELLIYQEPFGDTLFINKNELGGHSKDSWYYSFDIDYGRIYLKFNFSKQNSELENKKRFEYYLKNISVADFQQAEFYQFEKLDSPILLSQFVIDSRISGVAKIGDNKRYFLQTNLFEYQTGCRNFTTSGFSILSPITNLFESGDEILISLSNAFPISGRLKKEDIGMHLFVKKEIGIEEIDDGSWDMNKPILFEQIFTSSNDEK